MSLIRFESEELGEGDTARFGEDILDKDVMTNASQNGYSRVKKELCALPKTNSTVLEEYRTAANICTNVRVRRKTESST